MRYCVIMCGGIGSRFWPVSRQEKPKQFLDFFGTGRSLLQMTVDRILPLVDMSRILLVTNRQYADMIAEQLPDLPRGNILCEPARRNTAPCICWAANHIKALDPDASMVVLASDHLIMREEQFRDDIREGLEYVEATGNLLTLGVKPTCPHTGYGYIQTGAFCEDFPAVRRVKSFTEKPDLEMAKLFVSSGEVYWNSGMFLWRVSSILEAFRAHAPEMAALFEDGAGVYGTEGEMQFIDTQFPNANNISIDYAIMEKASNVYVKTVDFGWTDLGTWKALYDISPRNQRGNVTQNCEALETDCTNSVFTCDAGKIIVASGLDGYIVAQSGNVLMVYPMEKEQQIRQVVNEVKTRFGEDFV